MPTTVDFYRLPRPVQDRFAAATRRTAPPAPLLFRPAPRTVAWICLAASVVLIALESVLLAIGFGRAESALALHDSRMIAVDAVLLAGAAYCVLHAIAVLVSLDRLPWRAGRYLFPGCAVDACRSALEVWRIEDVATVERVAGPRPGVALRMRDGAQVVVAASSQGEAERAYEALEAVRREQADAIASEDSRVMAELDPLHDRAMSSPIGPTEAMTPRVPLWMRLDWVIAACVGVVLGQLLGATRNATSDDAMYRAAVAANTAPAYEAYLRRHGRHADEVEQVLLPRVELRDAEASGNLDAIRGFARTHEGSKIGPEIDASLRRAMLAELEKAKKPGTVAALDAFAREYPAEVVEPELRTARHALFARALGAWRAKAHPDAATDAFMERLVGWAEKNGKPVEVRFRTSPSTSMEAADKSVMHSPHYPGPDALPSHYLGPDALRQDEQGVVAAVVAKFAEAFPADVLSAHAGDPLGPDEPAPSGVPVLVIADSVEWSHGNTFCPKPPTIFVGLSFQFDAVFTIPDAPPPLKTGVKTWRTAEPWRIKANGAPLAEYEAKIYGAMLNGAYDQIRRKLVDILF